MNTTTYYIGTHPHSFRSGEAASIRGVVISEIGTPCFDLVYCDGYVDRHPISDVGNYQIVSADQVRAKFMPV